MADLARIKSNVAKMAAQNAPEADIDGYIASEGVTIDDVRAFKAGAQPKAGRIGEDPVAPINGTVLFVMAPRTGALPLAAALRKAAKPPAAARSAIAAAP